MGRKPLLPDIEDQLQDWIESLREKNIRVTRSSLMKKAAELFQATETEEIAFSASRGWLEKFLKHKESTLRHRTTVSQRLPSDLIPKVAHFVIYNCNLMVRHSYPLSVIGNMDETPVWLACLEILPLQDVVQGQYQCKQLVMKNHDLQ